MKKNSGLPIQRGSWIWVGLCPTKRQWFWKISTAFYNSSIDHLHILLCRGIHVVTYYNFDGCVLTSKWAREIKLGTRAVKQAGGKASEAAERSAQSIWHPHSDFLTHLCVSKNRYQASLKAQLVKKPPAMQETPVWFLGGEDPLEKG